MIDELKLFKGQNYVINEHIKITHPTLAQICDYGEEKYYRMISNLCSTPSDYKVQLADNFNIDYEKVNEFDFFCSTCSNLCKADTSIILGELDFTCFKLAVDNSNKELIFYDEINDIVIDNAIYTLLTNYLRKIHGFEKNITISGNEHTKKYLLDKERRQFSHKKNCHYKSTLAPLVSAMINCEQFKYNYDTVWELPIYVFMDSVQRIIKLKNYNNVMQGIYTGTIEFKALSQESLNWMGSLSES